MKKIISALLLIVMVLGTVPAYATSANTNAEPQRHYLGDGSYYIDTLTVQTSSLRGAASKDASKTRQSYDANAKLAWTFTVIGTFAYDGSTAKSKNASCSASIKVSGWTCASKNAYCSGSSVIGNATFKYNSTPQTAEVKITCKPSGDIS